MPVAVGSPAPDAVFCDISGGDVHLSDFWRDRPTVFLFRRHFGCPFFRKQLDDMRRHYDAVRTRGTEVVAIGLDVRGSLMPHSDWFQLPGVAIVDRDGIVRYLHRSHHPGDLPPADDVLAVVVAITTDA